MKNMDYTRKFLFGPAGIEDREGALRVSLTWDRRTEGWIGIPHGGIGMGMLMDLALLYNGDEPPPDTSYPLSGEYRFGGASLGIGDKTDVAVFREGTDVSGRIWRMGNDDPYLCAHILYGREDLDQKGQFLSFLPRSYGDIKNRLLPLPHYVNCFVCGMERTGPGLRRSFYFIDEDAREKIVVAPVGFEERDAESFSRFQRHGFLHPLPFLALLDETLGWAGFLASASGGVTVRINYTFYRNIKVGERVVCFGRGERVRGKAPSRVMFWASGGAAVVGDNGVLAPVITASGQWLGVPALTGQMRESLIPIELIRRAFALAER